MVEWLEKKDDFEVGESISNCKFPAAEITDTTDKNILTLLKIKELTFKHDIHSCV